MKRLILGLTLAGCGTDEPLGRDDLRPCDPRFPRADQCDELCVGDAKGDRTEPGMCRATNAFGVLQSDGSEPRFFEIDCSPIHVFSTDTGTARGCCVVGGAFSETGNSEKRFFECEAE